ncbi:glutathione peroxidase [Temperatibacter marinus]|uniref:Glutathione peroxidase n=1 Tax=Temperatibacter marinus TaxID=1456591 RepID=A0AA52H9W0_9PROT|nr:glutathione peroxidase [Temperatibacter marinus]WND02003.1 glutathione peroxidase [Temperatibacter marinus]
MTNVHDFKANLLNGTSADLSEFKGKVLLIVNTASKCGLTPQYEGLEALYKDIGNENFEILGFPCNQFGNQEPGSSDDIGEFCQINYGVSFPMFEKIEVNGDNTHPLYQHLKSEKKGLLGSQKIKWNFTKFLINQAGEVVKRYAPTTKPEKIRSDIEALV